MNNVKIVYKNVVKQLPTIYLKSAIFPSNTVVVDACLWNMQEIL